MKRSIILIAALIIVSAAFAVSDRQGMVAQAPSGKLVVTASFYPLYFFASEIGGDKVDVGNITPAGAEPHEYEPTAQDMARIENSAILILNGGHLEAWGDAVQKNLDSKRIMIVTAGDGLVTQQVVDDGETALDPHIWLSPILAGKMADKIADALKAADPVNAAYYDAHVQVLKSKLAELDAQYARGLSSCAQKDIITSHAAFGYLAAAYHLSQVPIAGLSPDAEPSPRQLADIARFAKDKGVQYIFFESLVSPKLSQTIASEIGAATLVLNPIEGLSQDELAQGKTYLTEMRSNLSNLELALQCKK